MCGICGWLYHDRTRPVAEDLLHRAAKAMIHRGPDSEGLWAGVGAGLAMRRLAIIDVESGQQPMTSPDGRIVLVYNGEIYNHNELRRELEGRGHHFETRCDTEVVLHSYLEWGADCLTRFNGMWGLALYDREAHELFLARDRLGIKPLYYALRPEGLAFASEIKCLFADTTLSREPDLQALSQFLYYRFVPAPKTGFEGIQKLPPAHYLRIRDHHTECVRYWHPTLDAPYAISEVDALGRLDELLDASVSSRLMSDVPLGVMLSGGVDSSLVASRAVRHHPGIDSFTIGFDSPEYDESAYARRVAEHLGTRFHREKVVGGALDQLETIAWHVEEPLGDSSVLPLLALCRMTKKNVTVALAGDGG
ncbi:MAG: asparagine synthase (glutamine-hydrolyzing), partial [Planctomycetota bacterium]